MRLTYDPQSMVLSIRHLPLIQIEKSRRVGPGVVCHYDALDKFLGIDIWGGPLELEVLS